MLYIILTLLLLPLLVRRASGTGRILVVQTAKIGDVILSTPLLGSLRASFPNARITLMHQPMTAELATDHPWVDARIELLPGRLGGLRAKLSIARQLRSQDFDVALVLSPGTPLLVAIAWAGIPARLAVMPTPCGSTMHLARRLLTGHVLHEDNQPLVDSQLKLVRLLGGTKQSSSQLVAIASAWGPDADEVDAFAIRVGVGVGAANALKSLDNEILAAVCRGISRLPGACAVLIGASGDAEKAGGIRTLAGDANIVDMTGRYSLAQLPVLIRRLQVFVGVDSGITHMADALGVPQVIVSGPVKMVEVMPHTAGSRIIPPPPLPCAPCTTVLRAAYRCATGTHACVRSTDPGSVVAAVADILEASGNLTRQGNLK